MPLMLSNETVKDKLLVYIKEYGVMQSHIAKICKCSSPSISLFLKGMRDLSQDKLAIIVKEMER